MGHPRTVSKTSPAICAAISGGICKYLQQAEAHYLGGRAHWGVRGSQEQQDRARAGKADHAAVFDGDIQGVPVGVEHGGRLDPPGHVLFDDAFFEDQIYPDGPLPAPPERRTRAPGVRYSV
jgi:hypothetical protein